MKRLILVFSVLATTGCQTLMTGADTALSAAAVAQPQYAGAIEQIQTLLRSGQAGNPVEGFDHATIWRYDGQIIDAGNLTREDRYFRVQNASDATIVSVVRDADDADPNAALRAQIEAILTAAGVTDE